MLAELVPTNDKLLTAVAFAKVKDGVPASGMGTARIPLQDRYHAGPFGFERAIHLPPVSEKEITDGYTIYGLDNLKRVKRYINTKYPLPKTTGLKDFKLFVSESYGSGEFGEKTADEILGRPGELCTETFLQIGPFKTEAEARNCLSYWKTKFFRALIGVKKNTQHCTKEVYQYVPMQDFSKPWTDKELYEKYGLDQKEIDFIENNVEAMED